MTEIRKAPKGADLSHIAEDLRSLAVRCEDIQLDPDNVRKHKLQGDVTSLAHKIARFGQRTPVVVQRSTGIVSKGNGTTMAIAQILGHEYIAAVIVDDDKLDAVAYAISDNRAGEESEWDDDALPRWLSVLRDEGLLEVTGFTDDDLQKMLDDIPEPDLEDGEGQGEGEDENRPALMVISFRMTVEEYDAKTAQIEQAAQLLGLTPHIQEVEV